MQETTKNPNSVSELNKIWDYKKKKDGTLEITSYKGSSTKIDVPSIIGKAKVTSIGEEAQNMSEEELEEVFDHIDEDTFFSLILMLPKEKKNKILEAFGIPPFLFDNEDDSIE